MVDARRPDDRREPLDRRITVSRLPREGTLLRIGADEAERAALAELLSILAVERVSAEITALPWRRDGVLLKGRLDAEIVQESVVTLEPVPQSIHERIELLFVPETSRLARPDIEGGGELHLDPEGDDPPDTYAGDTIDLGAALREILALALDPYPREPDADLARVEGAPEAPPEDDKVSPFASLARLKPGPPDG